MYFRESVKGIIKSKLFSLIIIIQLTVAFFTLIAAVNMIQGSLNQLFKVKSIFNENCTIRITDSSSMSLTNTKISDIDSEKIFQYYKNILKDNNINKIGIMSTSTNGIERTMPDLQGVLSNNSKSEFINTIYTDKNFYKYISNINLNSGRNFSEEDFNKSKKDIIPIIISDDLKKYLSLGQTFQNKYQVIGILKNNNKLFYNNKSSLYLGVTQAKNTIIIPINYKDKNNIEWVTNSFLSNGMITLKNKNLANQYIKKLNKDLATICPIPLKITKVIDERSSFLNLIKGGIIATLSISSLLIIYSFFGITGIILTSLIRRNREFGVKLSLGWTFKDICVQVYLEIFLIVICSYAISTIGSLLLLKNEMYQLNIYTYLAVLLLVLIFSFIYSILPIHRIKKLNIVDLIKDVR